MLIAGHLRDDRRMTSNYIKRAYTQMGQLLNTSHPFARRELWTDGFDLFIWTARESGESELVEPANRQHAFESIVRPYLEQIEWDPRTLLASTWRPEVGVAIDPRLGYGKPTVEGTGVPTQILYSAFEGNGRDADLVADWFNVTRNDVLAVVQFECRTDEQAA